MSNYEWEQGTITLPPKEARRIRGVLTDAYEKERALVTKEAEGFLAAKGSGGRTPESFKETLKAWQQDRVDTLRKPLDTASTWNSPSEAQVAAIHRQTDAVYQASGFFYRRAQEGNLKKPGKRELENILEKPAKTGKVRFDVGGEASITLEGNSLHWNVPENNHAVDRAHGHPMGQVLFRELDAVKEWPKGTGGQILGNNEYRREQEYSYEGGGGSYKKVGFGPLGDPTYATPTQIQKELAKAQQKRTGKNAGKCMARNFSNGKAAGKACQNSAHSCQWHGPRRSRSLGY